MDIIRGGSGRRRPGTASQSLRPSTAAQRSWSREAMGVTDAGGKMRRRPSTAPSVSSLKQSAYLLSLLLWL